MVDDLITSWEYVTAISAQCNIYCAFQEQKNIANLFPVFLQILCLCLTILQSNEPTSNFWSVLEYLLQKLFVCFNKTTKSRLCSFNSFSLAQKIQKKDVRMLRMIPGVEPSWHHLCTNFAYSQIFCDYLTNAILI